ncbi:MAG: hypothetical protein WCW44_04880 [archaeon]|jgi:hypothetical protein
MAIKYVNKSGSDSYDGTSQTFVSGITGPKLTISGAITGSASGDTIIVGSGLYNERPSSTLRNFYADGTVIVDGSGFGSGYLFQMSGGAGTSYTIGAYTTGGQWIFQNNVGAALLYLAVNTTTVYYLNNCVFRYSPTNTIGVSCYGGGGQTCAINMSYCVFSGAFTYAVQSNSGYSATSSIYYNTFYGCGTGFYAPQTHLTYMWNNIFSNITTAWYQVSATNATLVSFNNQFYNITNWRNVANTYTTLAQAQVAGFEQGSIFEDPTLTDPANEVFFLETVSPLGPKVGAYPFGLSRGAGNDSDSKWIITGTADNSGWYNPDGNITKSGTTGSFELSGGTAGVLWSPVYNLSGVATFSRINLATVQYWPTNMVDTTGTDTQPNAQTMEVRVSNSTYNQGDASPSWTEVRYNGTITPSITGQYIQFRITLRNNNVQA